MAYEELNLLLQNATVENVPQLAEALRNVELVEKWDAIGTKLLSLVKNDATELLRLGGVSTVVDGNLAKVDQDSVPDEFSLKWRNEFTQAAIPLLSANNEFATLQNLYSSLVYTTESRLLAAEAVFLHEKADVNLKTYAVSSYFNLCKDKNLFDKLDAAARNVKYPDSIRKIFAMLSHGVATKPKNEHPTKMRRKIL